MPLFNDLPKPKQDQLEKFLKRYSILREARANWENTLQQCTDFIHPHRGDFSSERTPGSRRTNRLYDSAPVVINQHFAAGLQSRLVPPGEKWVALRVADDEALNRDDDVRFWLDNVTDYIYHLFNRPSSNFNASMHESFLDLGAYGTSPIEIVMRSTQRIVFNSRHLGDFCFIENEFGMINGCFRTFQWPWYMIFERWPQVRGNLAPGMNNDADQNPDKRMEILHIILPNDSNNRNVFSPNGKAFLSIYLLMKDKTVFEVGGFNEFPYVVPRYEKTTGEVLGRSPGMVALPDILMLQQMAKTVIRSAQKMVDPPLLVPDDGFLGPVKTMPSGLNYYRSGTQDRIEALETKGRPELGMDMIVGVREQITKIFFVDMFQLPERPKSHQEMREVEVMQRKQDQMSLTTPLTTRMQTEALGPIVRRVYNMLKRSNQLPPAPRALQNRKLKIEYTSPLVRDQQIVQLQGLFQMMQLMSPFIQIDPGIMDNMDQDEAMRWVMKAMRFPEELHRSTDEVNTIRSDRQEKQQMQEAALAAESVSGSLKNVAQAEALSNK